MTRLDVFAQSNWGRFGPTQGDIDIVSGSASLSLPVSTVAHYHCKSLRVRAGATLNITSALDINSVPHIAWVFVDGDVLIEGTLTTALVVTSPTPTATNWDGATDGGNGTSTTSGANGTKTSKKLAIQDILYNGHYNTAVTDYRYYQLFRNWLNAGYGGYGYQNGANANSSLPGAGGGGLVIVARGKITVANGGVIHSDGGVGGTTAAGASGAWAGHGGGAGGIVGLISWVDIYAPAGARISANGGNGGNGTVAGNRTGGRFAEGGYGGGGGLVFTFSPHKNIGLNVEQRAAGSNGTPAAGAGVLNAFGGGGGGSFGAGGGARGAATAGVFAGYPSSSGSSVRGHSQWVNV